MQFRMACMSCMHFGLIISDHESTLSYLLQPENMHAYRSSNGHSLLHIACAGYFRIKDRLQIIDDLIDTFGFTLTHVNHKQFNIQCIHIASEKSHPSIVHALLIRDPELAEVTDARGMTPLMHACHGISQNQIRMKVMHWKWSEY